MTENENLEKQIADDLSAVLKEAKSMGCKEVACFRHIPLQNVEIKINALYEVQKYRAIGTIEEFKDLKEKSAPYKPKEYEDRYYACKCGNPLLHKWDEYPTKLMPKSRGLSYCLNCGQKLDWSE